jgi:hypothetical protein
MSEYTGEFGPTGVPLHKPQRAVTASEEARMARLTGLKDPAEPINWRVWYGEGLEKTARQVEGDKAEGNE